LTNRLRARVSAAGSFAIFFAILRASPFEIYKHACALGCEVIVWGSAPPIVPADRRMKIKNPEAPAVRRLEEEDWT
jgi:hypothetical protein